MVKWFFWWIELKFRIIVFHTHCNTFHLRTWKINWTQPIYWLKTISFRLKWWQILLPTLNICWKLPITWGRRRRSSRQLWSTIAFPSLSVIASFLILTIPILTYCNNRPFYHRITLWAWRSKSIPSKVNILCRYCLIYIHW